MSRRVQTTSADQTEALGAEIAATLRPGDVVLVSGELSAGKTTFIRGACRALGVTVPITSPTFTIGQRYHGHVPVSHLDLFRVQDVGLEEPGLLVDYLGADTVGFVEWPDSGAAELSAIGRVAARIRIEHAGADRRVVELSDGDGRAAQGR